jgi:putative endopeptidase
MKFIVIAALCLCYHFVVAQNKPDFLADNIDKTTPASVDFFQYANGGWIKKTPIPASESGWGIGNLVQEEIYNRILDINKKAAALNDFGGEDKTAEQKIGLFWTTAMDTIAINKKGIKDLDAPFKDIEKIKTVADIQKIVSLMHMFGMGAFFGSYIGQDDKNSEAMIQMFYQGGLGLPNREYYFKTDARTRSVQKAYKDYLLKSLSQMKAPNAAKLVNDIYNFEKKLATASRKLEDLRDPYKNYNKMTLAGLTGLAKQFNFEKYATYIGIKNIKDSIVVGQPEFFTALGKLMTTANLPVIKSYLKIRMLQNAAPYLDDKTYMNLFNYRKVLSGATTPRPRWKRILDSEEDAMGELLGQVFAKEYFNETAKKRYNDLVETIRAAYVERINKLTWMSDVTKKKALEKLAKVSQKVGYPDKWKDFTDLKIGSESYFDNMMSASIFWHQYQINKLGKPVDRNEWQMTPQTYNAYYNPSNNEIVLPAGIFAVPSMKDEELDDAFVYGYAGASTIGHEITHGFDDQGRQYDAVGNLSDWWTKEDGEEYIKRAKAIIEQYNEFVPVDTLHVNGEATQGENIADLGGLLLGLDAFKKTQQYKDGKLIGGLTPLQRYFLGYAYGWMYQVKKERLANQVMTDVHSPAKERVNGPMVNIPEFYEAFGIKDTNKMYRPTSKRVSIW